MSEDESPQSERPEHSETALQKAVSYLARREHSQSELRWKLSSRGYDEIEIEEALERLVDQGLQSDERFAEAFVQMRYQRGSGPYKINMELNQKGVDETTVEQALNSDEFDWFELARSVYEKKYRGKGFSNYQEKAKRSRFLQSRGFSSEQIQYAIDGE